MCIERRSGHARLACVVLFLVGIVLPLGLCQNAEPRGAFGDAGNAIERSNGSYVPGAHERRSRNAYPEGEKALVENGRTLSSRGAVEERSGTEAEAKAEIHGDVGRGNKRLPASGNGGAGAPPRLDGNATRTSSGQRGRRREGDSGGGRARKKRRGDGDGGRLAVLAGTDYGRGTTVVVGAGDSGLVSENEIRGSGGTSYGDVRLSRKRNGDRPSSAARSGPRDREARKSRAERRRRRRKDRRGRRVRTRGGKGRSSSRRDVVATAAAAATGRSSSKYRRRTRTQARTQGAAARVKADPVGHGDAKYPSVLEESTSVSAPDARGDFTAYGAAATGAVGGTTAATTTTTTTSSSWGLRRPAFEATRRPTRGSTQERRGGIYADTVEREFSKQLELEISRSASKDPTFLEDGIFDAPLLSPTARPTAAAATAAGGIDAGFGSSRYDAARMLGYTRTEEDLPILDLENEVLARTLKDYNAYMTSSLRLAASASSSSSSSSSLSSSARLRNGARVGSIRSPRKPIINSQESDDEDDDDDDDNDDDDDDDDDDNEGGVGEAEVTGETRDDNTAGDLSCINGTFLPAPLSRHALIKYVKSSTPGHEYLEADYECVPGFHMVSAASRLVCRSRQWVGQVPKCEIRQNPSGACARASCEHVCNEINGRPVCSCYRGFRLDGHKCVDVNECDTGNAGCEYKCANTPGSFRCECPNGMKRGRDRLTCADINECLLNNGHGPCQDTCRNLIGGYECSCEGLPDAFLAADNHTCVHRGPCSVNNAGCSHTCLSTMGRVFCLCPDGFMLEDDWKTCQDVDECSVPDLQTELCHHGCINTPGSYRCTESTELKDQPILDSLSITCLPGYEQTARGTCVDINECVVDNGGCTEVCENTDGSFFCACDGDEKALSSDGKSCVDINSIACTPLNPVGRGYLMCSRLATSSELWRERRKAPPNRPGTRCFLKCPRGYQLRGEYELTCRSDGTWDGPKHGKCVRYSQPQLECPKDVVAELPPGRDEAFVTFDQPATDLDWFRYVRSRPAWGVRLEANLKPGVHEITFYARHPLSKRQASCVLRIIVKDGEAPKVKDCPNDIEVVGRNGTAITWTEPTFTDNVKATRISNNESPGRRFDVGGHRIEYEASDEAGWSSKCVFAVVLRQK